MHAQYLLVNDSCDRKAVETVREGLPDLDVVPTLTWKVHGTSRVSPEYQ